MKLACEILFCLAILVSWEEDKKLDDDELEASEEDCQGNLDQVCNAFRRVN